MSALSEILNKLPVQHRNALDWFIAHQSENVPWPDPLPDGTYLVNRPKGIHKPAGWQYALSVRQSLDGPYADQEPKFHDDGTWSYRYYQEQLDPADRDKLFTNKSLLAAKDDRIPIGVLRQTSRKPNVRYRVLGIALVRQWENGYFLLEGFSAQDCKDAIQITSSVSIAPLFDPHNLTDARKRIAASIVQRQGQGKFRHDLLKAYGGRCAITGCDAQQAIEAAHIVPYLGTETNAIQNGILLRSDLHTLFDLGLIAIDTNDMSIVIGEEIRQSVYSELCGKPLRLPSAKQHHPSKEALDRHLSQSRHFPRRSQQ